MAVSGFGIMQGFNEDPQVQEAKEGMPKGEWAAFDMSRVPDWKKPKAEEEEEEEQSSSTSTSSGDDDYVGPSNYTEDPRTQNPYMPDEQTPESWRYNPNDDGTVTDVHGTEDFMPVELFNQLYGDQHPSDVDTEGVDVDYDPSGANESGGTYRVSIQRPDQQDKQQDQEKEIWDYFGMTREEWLAMQQEQQGPTGGGGPYTPPGGGETNPEPPVAGSSSLGTVAVAGGGMVGILAIAYLMGWL